MGGGSRLNPTPMGGIEAAPPQHIMSISGPAAAGALAFYADALAVLKRGSLEFLVGGGFALERYTGIARDTKDLDVFVRPRDRTDALDALGAAGYHTAVAYPHWLGKAQCGDHILDVIWSSGNGVTTVDDLWFRHAVGADVLGVPVHLNPVEEMIWSKSFVMERERFDGADVAHLLDAQGRRLDWDRLLWRFGRHWRVLLSHLVLFGFIYPGRRPIVPAPIMRELLGRLKAEGDAPGEPDRLCQGTLLSRKQYLPDINDLGYEDARLVPRGDMTPDEVSWWTQAIDEAPQCLAALDDHANCRTR